MADDTKREDQLKEYVGCVSQFASAPHFRAQRNISDFELYEHQADTLQRINTEISQGKSTFLGILTINAPAAHNIIFFYFYIFQSC